MEKLKELKKYFPIGKLIVPGNTKRFLIVSAILFFGTQIVDTLLFGWVDCRTIISKLFGLVESALLIYAAISMCIVLVVYLKKSDKKKHLIGTIIGIAAGGYMSLVLVAAPALKLSWVFTRPLNSMTTKQEMEVVQIEEGFIQEDNNTVIEQYEKEEVFEEETEEVVEEPEYLIPVSNEMIEPYFDSEKGEVAIRDMLSGSVIKFTYDTNKYGIFHHEEDSVYFYWKGRNGDWFKITTTIDSLYPEIHSYEAYYNMLNPTDRDVRGGQTELLANCETRYMYYEIPRSANRYGSYGGEYMSAYITMPDGSHILTPYFSVDKYDGGLEVMNSIFTSFALYTTGGYIEQNGDIAPLNYEVPWAYSEEMVWCDDAGNELFEYYYTYDNQKIIIGEIFAECEIPSEIDGKPIVEAFTFKSSQSQTVYPDTLKEIDATVSYTENGWQDGKVVVPNLRRINGSIKTSGEVIMPESIEYITGSIIGNASSVIMPQNLKAISGVTSSDSQLAISKIHFQEGENDIFIGDRCFTRYGHLEDIYLSDNIVYIGTQAFHSIDCLKTINLPANLRYIGESAFEKTRISGTYVIPDGTIYMGYSIFPEEVDTLVIPDSVKELYGQNAKTIITTSGSLAEAYALENGKELIIITEEEMEQYQSIYR